MDNPLSGPAVALSLLTLGFFDPWPGAQVNCAIHEEKDPTWAHPRLTVLHAVQRRDVEYGFLLQCPWMQLMVLVSIREGTTTKEQRCWRLHVV